MRRTTILILLALAMLLSTIPVQAQEGPSTPLGTGYDLSWWTADNGGTTNQAGASGYSLSGTIGQFDATTWSVESGSSTPYTLSGGFWFAGPAVGGYEIFLPVIVRGGP